MRQKHTEKSFPIAVSGGKIRLGNSAKFYIVSNTIIFFIS